MKALRREARPAKAKTEPAPAPDPKTKGAAAPAEGPFTARELDAAEQLIHLSESSASSGTPRARSVAYAALSGCSSPRSVNATPVPARAAVFPGGCAGWEEDEVAGSQRRVRRYRLIAEIYAEKAEFGGRGGSSRKKRTE